MVERMIDDVPTAEVKAPSLELRGDYRPYPAYTASGVEWLGEIPGHWHYQPLWTMFRRTKRTGHEGRELLSVYRDYGVIPKSSRDDNFNRPSEDLSSYQLVQPSDLVINKMKAWQGSMAISEHSGIVSPAYHVYVGSHCNDDRYLHHLFRSGPYVSAYQRISKGIRTNQWDLEPEGFSRIEVLLPPLAEQHAIAAFLDRETAKIDALVEKKERLIELLREKRTALISRAVTRGLDPNVPMKDSGVEWLGEIPAHWEVKPLRWTVKFQRGHDLPSDEREEGDVPLVSSSGVSSTQSKSIAKAPGIVTGRYGTIGKFQLVCEDYWPLNTTLYSIELYGNDPHFLHDMLSHLSPLFLLHAAKSAVPGVDRNDIHTVRTAVPPLSEQTTIATLLHREIATIDVLINKIYEAVERLNEFRSALISAAVTGRIDVRGETL